LKDVEVQAAIAARMAEREKRTEITTDRVLRELAKIAFGDPRAVMAWGPGGVKIKESSTLTDDQAAFVSEISESVTESSRTLKLKTNDKLKACELIGRHLGMFKDKLEIGLSNLSDEELKVELAGLILEAIPVLKSDV
jgi:phage terminase small subunit